ncbi:MAG: dipeptidase [Acidobacteria bacterium]|nr:dipeptidase [Acidobacteriota bacterium]
MPKRLTIVLLITMFGLAGTAWPCSNILVTKGASTDGSTFIAYVSDSHTFYGYLNFEPAETHRPGEMREIIDWDTGKKLGEIPQAPRTYQVVGLMNEHQVMLGETTFDERKELVGPSGMIDYGSLMFIALERARTAREAIKVMTSLAEKYGYASDGESFSVGDPNEAWILEMVGKGKGHKGVLWVARKVPDGEVSAHANQSRIRTFPLHDPGTCLYAKDVISFARKKGWYSGPDDRFSFADTYAPISFGAVRFCEARVWNVFRRVAPSLHLGVEYADGYHLDKRLPFAVKPDRRLSVADVMSLLRDHFEGTPFDLTKGVGAGPFGCPYRWRPLVWKVDGKKYVNERAISTQQTGMSFVSQARSFLPDPIGGVHWFGVDDTASTVYVPIYCGVLAIPHPYAKGVADLYHFSWNSAFWVFNWVANYAYSRYSDMIVDIRKVQHQLEGSFLAAQPGEEAAALALYRQSPRLARQELTRYSVAQGDRTVKRWRKLGEQLLVKYMDGNVKDEQGHVTHPPYPKWWYRLIVKERGPQIRVPESPKH